MSVKIEITFRNANAAHKAAIMMEALADACSEINDVSNYVCEVTFNEE